MVIFFNLNIVKCEFSLFKLKYHSYYNFILISNFYENCKRTIDIAEGEKKGNIIEKRNE